MKWIVVFNDKYSWKMKEMMITTFKNSMYLILISKLKIKSQKYHKITITINSMAWLGIQKDQHNSIRNQFNKIDLISKKKDEVNMDFIKDGKEEDIVKNLLKEKA